MSPHYTAGILNYSVVDGNVMFEGLGVLVKPGIWPAWVHYSLYHLASHDVRLITTSI